MRPTGWMLPKKCPRKLNDRDRRRTGGTFLGRRAGWGASACVCSKSGPTWGAARHLTYCRAASILIIASTLRWDAARISRISTAGRAPRIRSDFLTGCCLPHRMDGAARSHPWRCRRRCTWRLRLRRSRCSAGPTNAPSPRRCFPSHAAEDAPKDLSSDYEDENITMLAWLQSIARRAVRFAASGKSSWSARSMKELDRVDAALPGDRRVLESVSVNARRLSRWHSACPLLASCMKAAARR